MLVGHPNSVLRDEIRAEALRLGFDACGFASASDAWPNGGWLREFVAEGFHGAMGWMEETLERRAHPTAMWDGARTAIVLGLNYGPDTDPLSEMADRSAGYVSVYARGDDYHEVIKGRLKTLAGQIAARTGEDVKVFVDTAPLMEKPLAQRAGLGWQGKHTNLLSRTDGNWLFLGVILTAAELEPDPPEGGHCGTCTACLDVCPTNAFPAPFQLDARRCLSYLTIEFAGPWPDEFRTATGSRIYGCDDCLAVCPWNKFAAASNEAPCRRARRWSRPGWPIWRRWTMRPSGRCSRRARSSGSAATASSGTSSTPSATAPMRPSPRRCGRC
jgi:epoxyqueuosine reductase